MARLNVSMVLLILFIRGQTGSAQGDQGHGPKEWHLRFQAADTKQRAQMVWSLALSADTRRVVKSLGPAAIPAIIGGLDDHNQQVVEGSLWVLCSLSDKQATAACASAVEAPPGPVSQRPPYYPLDAFDQRIEGTVEVQVLIDSEGRVSHAAILKSVKALDTAALHCVRDWKFQPAAKGGRPVASVAIAPVRFRIY